MPRKKKIDPMAIESPEALAAWMVDRGWTNRALADALDVSRATVERWRRGDNAISVIARRALAHLDTEQAAS